MPGTSNRWRTYGAGLAARAGAAFGIPAGLRLVGRPGAVAVGLAAACLVGPAVYLLLVAARLSGLPAPLGREPLQHLRQHRPCRVRPRQGVLNLSEGLCKEIAVCN
jgi:hypothetical protein